MSRGPRSRARVRNGLIAGMILDAARLGRGTLGLARFLVALEDGLLYRFATHHSVFFGTSISILFVMHRCAQLFLASSCGYAIV